MDATAMNDGVNWFILTVGILGIILWGYAIFCVFYKQIVVDRILSRSKYWYVMPIFFMIALLPFSIATVAHFNNVKPFDILYYTRPSCG